MLQEIEPFNLEHYKITHIISKSDFGILYRAYDNNLERHVALRILAAEYTKDSNFITNFFHDARTAARISHPNMVQIYDISEEDSRYFITSEYIEGISLQKHLSRNVCMSLPEIIPIIIDMCQLLKYIWEKDRIIHKNISSKYIFITRSQHKLNHLSLNNFLRENNPESQNKNTLYSSPEQILKKPLDFRCDIYHLGIVLYQAITGQFPFDGKDQEEISSSHLKGAILNPQKYVKSLPGQFTILINKMLAKHPNDRYTNYDSLIRDLKLVENTAKQGKKNPFKRMTLRTINSPAFIIWFLVITLFASFSYIIYIKSTENLEKSKVIFDKNHQYESFENLKRQFSKEDLPELKVRSLQKQLNIFTKSYPNSDYQKIVTHWQEFIKVKLKRIAQINNENYQLRALLNNKKFIPFEGFHIENLKRDTLTEIISQTFKTNKFSDAKLILLKNFTYVPIEFKGWKNTFIKTINMAEKIYNSIIFQKFSLYDTTITINNTSYTIIKINDALITAVDNKEDTLTISIFDLTLKHINHITNNINLYKSIMNYNAHLASFFIWAKRYNEAQKAIQFIEDKKIQKEFSTLIKMINQNSSYTRNRIIDLLKDLHYYIELEDNTNIKLYWLKLQKLISTDEYKGKNLEIKEIQSKLKEEKII